MSIFILSLDIVFDQPYSSVSPVGVPSELGLFRKEYESENFLKGYDTLFYKEDVIVP